MPAVVEAALATACPACGSDDAHEAEGVHGDYTFRHCRACDVVFADPMRSMDYNAYTARNQYVVRDFLMIHQEHRMWNYREFLKMELARGGRLLDIGCGNGAFLNFARRNGYRVCGSEVDEHSAELARRWFRLQDIVTGPMPRREFDVATLWEVIEHVERPAELVGEIRERLSRGGWFVLSTPNRDRWPKFHYSWDDPPHHLTRWSERALRGMLERNGFRVERVIHGWENLDFHLLEKLDVQVLMKWNVLMVKNLLQKMIRLPEGRDRERLRRSATLLANWKYFLVKACAMPFLPLLRGMGSRGAHLLVVARAV